MIETISDQTDFANAQVPAGKILIKPDGSGKLWFKDSSGNFGILSGISEVGFDSQPIQDATSGNIYHRLDDSATLLNLIGDFNVTADSKLRLRVRSADTAESGNAALKVVVNGTALAEQVFAIPTAGAWTDIELAFSGTADDVQITVQYSATSWTLAASIYIQRKGWLE